MCNGYALVKTKACVLFPLENAHISQNLRLNSSFKNSVTDSLLDLGQNVK